MVDLLVLYVMKVMNVDMCTRSMMKLCYEMLMELERIFMFCNMSCNVRNVYVMLVMRMQCHVSYVKGPHAYMYLTCIGIFSFYVMKEIRY